MQKRLQYGLVLATLLGAACGGSDTVSIKAEPPSGTFGGQAWTMTKATVKKSGESLSISLFAEAVADCASSGPSGSTKGFLLWSMPAQVGERPLKLSLFNLTDPSNQTVTFVTPPSSNNIATEGLVKVTALSTASVTIGVAATAGSGNDINGTFTTNLCP